MFHHCNVDYLSKIFSGPERFASFVEKIRQELVAFGIKTPFTHIAVRGVSGIAMGAAVCFAARKNLIVVRKECELIGKTEDGGCHSGYPVEGIPIEPFNYIILDDLICSGRTVNRITDAITKENNQANRVGIFTYLGGFKWKKTIEQ